MDSYHVKSLHATVLTKLGRDPDKLTYFYGGRDQKLVGVEGSETMKKLIGAMCAARHERGNYAASTWGVGAGVDTVGRADGEAA